MITLKNISKEINGSSILQNVNHTFNSGVNVIKGENGCGKTTLLNIIGSHDTKFSGEVDSTLTISYFPDVLSVFEDITVSTFTHSILSEMKVSFDKQYEYFIKYLNIDDLLTKKIKGLSIGQRKKVILFLTLIDQRDGWVLDEPFSGLDDDSLASLTQFLKDNVSKTIIISTHRNDLNLKIETSLQLL